MLYINSVVSKNLMEAKTVYRAKWNRDIVAAKEFKFSMEDASKEEYASFIKEFENEVSILA